MKTKDYGHLYYLTLIPFHNTSVIDNRLLLLAIAGRRILTKIGRYKSTYSPYFLRVFGENCVLI